MTRRPSAQPVQKGSVSPSRAGGMTGVTAPRTLAASVEIIVDREHQGVLDVVQGVHPLGDADVLLGTLGEGMGLVGDEALDPPLELDRDLPLVGEVEHLELVEHLVDLADLVAPRVAGDAFGLVTLGKVPDLQAGLLDHPDPLSAGGPSRAHEVTNPMRHRGPYPRSGSPSRSPTGSKGRCPAGQDGTMRHDDPETAAGSRWSVEAAGQAAFPGFRLRRLARTASTQDVVRAAARAGAQPGHCVVAAEQTAGRGRQGRTWSVPPGSALLMSILVRPASPGGVPLVAGLAVGGGRAACAGDERGLKGH